MDLHRTTRLYPHSRGGEHWLRAQAGGAWSEGGAPAPGSRDGGAFLDLSLLNPRSQALSPVGLASSRAGMGRAIVSATCLYLWTIRSRTSCEAARADRTEVVELPGGPAWALPRLVPPTGQAMTMGHRSGAQGRCAPAVRQPPRRLSPRASQPLLSSLHRRRPHEPLSPGRLADR